MSATLLGGLALALAVFGYTLGLRWAERRWACTCGRSRWPYFDAKHGTTKVMVVESVIVALVAAIQVIGLLTETGSVVMTTLMLLLFAETVLAVYYHEKGKRKGSILRALGRVVVNDHGRLAVRA